MATITIPVPGDLYRKMEHLSLCNGLKLHETPSGKERCLRNIRSGKPSDEDVELCDKID
jgi:hypothetical protein